jgi:hypothetical protein
MEIKKIGQSLLWALASFVVSILISILCIYYRIAPAPTVNIIGKNGLFIVVGILALVIVSVHVYLWISRKNLLLFIFLISLFEAFLYQFLLVYAQPDFSTCYSKSQDNLKVTYECVCKTKYLESPYKYNYEDCQFSGIVFLPFAQQTILPYKRYGIFKIGVDKQANFSKYDWLGKSFDNEYPSQLLISTTDFTQIGYVNFKFSGKTNTFDISLIVDTECSKYYTRPVFIKNGENFSIRLCGKEYRFNFLHKNGLVITFLD